MSGKVPILDFELENNDLKYFYKLCHLIQNGAKHGTTKYGDISVLLEKPGMVNLARWITTASNILRLYCQTPKPDMSYITNKTTRYNKATLHYKKLVRFVKIILNLYGPMCFEIRIHYQVENGSKLLFHQLYLAKQILTPREKNVFDEVFKNNCYFAHSENVLLAMMFDESLSVRRESLKMILAARKRAQKAKKVRKFRLPKDYLNLNETCYWKMLDWSRMKPRDITEPPLLRKYSDEDLKAFSEGKINLEMSKIPCHSQAVERFVALTSSAASHEIGYTKRHANILNKQNSFKKFPTQFKKSHFSPK